jgi:hypothetical protein
MKVILALIFVSFPFCQSYAQTNQTESLTFTTYYPAPYGVYRNIKLLNITEPAVAPEPGMIYYDRDYHVVRYRNNLNWVNVTGGSNENWAVITVSCPWGHDGDSPDGGLGWGDQCNLTTNNCCALPACPNGWTEVSKAVKLAAIDAPKSCEDEGNEVGYEWMNGYDHAFNRPASVGNVARTCVKKGATVITLSHPWRSDHRRSPPNDSDIPANYMIDKGWGNQCTAASNYIDCGGPAPSCPAGWTNIGTNVEVYSVACPRLWDNPDGEGEGCHWRSQWASDHPLAGGALVTICEKN